MALERLWKLSEFLIFVHKQGEIVGRSSNSIGRLGELIFEFAILRDLYFIPAFLGDKWEAVDYLVELAGKDDHGYFFVQVKSTAQSKPNDRMLPMPISSEKLESLMSYPAPTYLAFVDTNSRKVFIKAAIDGGKYTSTPPVELTSDVCKALADEVTEFWSKFETNRIKATFESRFQ